MIHLITTFFYVGHLRPAPGTWGSLAAVIAGYGILWALGAWALGFGIMISFLLGWWATHHDTLGKDNHDPSEIVIDEVAGQWLAMLPLAYFGISWIGLLIAFVAFRFFDIWKIGPVGLMDARGDAFGVMADDIVAGLFAGIVLTITLGIFG